MLKWGWLLPAVLSAAYLRAMTQGGPQSPSFKAGIQLVRIDVSVLDEKRRPVRGLQTGDFTVLEDSQPRPIRAFTAVDHASALPAPPSTGAELVSDVATNRAGDDTSRLIFILMDRSIPTDRPMMIARQIADAAVDAMAPGDLAAIVTTGAGVPQNLTSDRARLHKTIGTSDWSQTPSKAQQDQGGGSYDPLSDPSCPCGLCVMDTVARIANDVRDVPRRKLLLFIGSNLIVQAGPRPMSTDIGCDTRVRDSRERLFDALGASGLTVHSIDPNGLASVGPQTRASVPNGVENRDGAVLREQLTQERNDFMAAQGNLEVLPALTGGRTVLNSNEPFRMVPEVLHESDAYYLLGFEPIDAGSGVRHTIEVKVARPGVTVHAARYLSPPKAAAAADVADSRSPLARALAALLPDRSLPLGVSVASFAGPDRDHAYVGITLDASAFATGPGSIPLEIAVLASDERGRRVGAAQQSGTVRVPSSGAGSPGMSAFVELQTYLPLPPGDYELRAAVMNSSTREASSVFTHITVPTFDDDRLTLSDVVLGTQENAGSLPDGAPAIPIVPTTARVLSQNAPAWAFLRVYRATEKGAAVPVSIDTSILDASGQRVRHQSLREAAFVGRNADVRLGLPLRDLAPGEYVLRIEAKQGRAETSRAIAFSVAAAPLTLTHDRSPALDATLAAAARYLEEYEHRIGAIGAEEEYAQAVQTVGARVVNGDPFSRSTAGNRAPATATTATRKTRANIITISLGARGWVSFRDVFELDGRAVRGREERLSRILQNVTPDSLEQARQIAAESGRYNLEPDAARLDRTINVPMTALFYLRAVNQPRSSFRLGKSDRVGGVECVTLQFTEQSRPRLIRTSDDAPAQGTFWIDMAGGGRIVKSELRMESAGRQGQVVRAQAAVTYSRVEKLDLWVPTAMDETYELVSARQLVTGHARYSDFREFTVNTSEVIK